MRVRGCAREESNMRKKGKMRRSLVFMDVGNRDNAAWWVNNTLSSAPASLAVTPRSICRNDGIQEWKEITLQLRFDADMIWAGTWPLQWMEPYVFPQEADQESAAARKLLNVQSYVIVHLLSLRGTIFRINPRPITVSSSTWLSQASSTDASM